MGKDGQVLLDFGNGGMRNFGIVLQPEIDSGAIWVKQQTISPRAPIVQTFQRAGGVELLEETFVVSPRSDSPAALPARRVVVLATLRNSATEEARRRPELRILSGEPVRSDQAESVFVGSGTRIQASQPGAVLASAASRRSYWLRHPRGGR